MCTHISFHSIVRTCSLSSGGQINLLHGTAPPPT